MKFQNCPRNFKHSEFSPIFSSIFPEILSRNEKLSSYRICPKFVSRIKIPILPKKFKHPGKHFSGILSSTQILRAT
jgi:hypothetical protein